MSVASLSVVVVAVKRSLSRLALHRSCIRCFIRQQRTVERPNESQRTRAQRCSSVVVCPYLTMALKYAACQPCRPSTTATSIRRPGRTVERRKNTGDTLTQGNPENGAKLNGQLTVSVSLWSLRWKSLRSSIRSSIVRAKIHRTVDSERPLSIGR